MGWGVTGLGGDGVGVGVWGVGIRDGAAGMWFCRDARDALGAP